MRLGGHIYWAGTPAELETLCERLDFHGLSTVVAPIDGEGKISDEACAEYGEKARELGIVVGEIGMWENLMTPDAAQQERRIQSVRCMLRKAEIMGCRCVVTLVGTRHPSDAALAPHPYLFTRECRREFREIVLRILDGLDLTRTRYAIEPWHNTFFYQPEDIREFLNSVGHPALALHLDQMNMVDQRSFFDTTSLIERTFELLADKVAAAHLKDIRCDHTHMFLKWDEVPIGDGVLDYGTYLRRLAELPADTPCFCEHMQEERDYALCFTRLHQLADKAGVRFLRREDRTQPARIQE